MKVNIPVKYVYTNVHTLCLDFSQYLLFFFCCCFWSFVIVNVQHLFGDIPQSHMWEGYRSNKDTFFIDPGVLSLIPDLHILLTEWKFCNKLHPPSLGCSVRGPLWLLKLAPGSMIFPLPPIPPSKNSHN